VKIFSPRVTFYLSGEEIDMKQQSQYAKLGVDAGKKNVRKTFGPIVENQYPNAFVNIIDHPTQDGVVCTLHMDGDGSKSVQRLLMYFESMNPDVFWGAVVDAMEMNMGDIAASGFVDGPIIIADTININGNNVPKDVILEQFATGFTDTLELYKYFGFDTHFLGGETADLPDQVKSIVFDVAVYAETKKENVVSGNVQVGDKIWGFASDGRAEWEIDSNSGLMSNGSTMARFKEMHPRYGKKYPQLIRDGGVFEGSEDADSSIAHALISPTRHFSVVIKLIIEALQEKNIFHMLHGISMNTGGGAAKIAHVGDGIVYCKTMPEPPLLFRDIQKKSGESWRNMFESFNCGVGIDVVGENNSAFAEVMNSISEQTHITLYDLGLCESGFIGQNKVILETPYGCFDDY